MEQKKFANFLKLQFNSALMKKLEIGQTVEYKNVKKILINIFDFCSQHQQLKDFTNYFYKHSIVMSAIKFVKLRSDKKVVDFFAIEDNASKYINPYLIIFFSKYLVKKDSDILRQTKNTLTNLLNVHLMLAINNTSNTALVRKLLKSALHLLIYCGKHLKELAESGEMK